MNRVDRVARVRRAAIALAAVGVVLRVAWAALGPRALVADALRYAEIARELGAGRGYAGPLGTTAYWVPGWPALVLVLERVGGEAGVVVGNVALSVATMALAARFAREAYGRSAGLVAAAVVGLTPSLVLLPTLWLSENLAMPLVLLALLVAIRAARSGAARSGAGSRAGWALLAGLAVGAAVLSREASAAALLGASLAASSPRLGRARRVLALGLVFMGAIALTAPWAIRNARAIGVLTLSTSAGENLCAGLGQGATGGWRRTFEDGGGPAAPPREANRHREGILCARDGILAHPLSPLVLAPGKLSRLVAFDDWEVDFYAWRWPDTAPGPLTPGGRAATTLAWTANVGYWALLALAALGVARGRARPAARAALWGTVFGTVLLVLITFGNGRFHALLLPLLAAPAARGVLALVRLFPERVKLSEP